LIALFLVGCGGGGGGHDDDSAGNVQNSGGSDVSSGAEPLPSTPPETTPAPATPPATANPAQGFYTGMIVGNQEHRTIVLDSGQFFMIHGPRAGDIYIISGLLEGHGQVNNGTFTSTDMKFYYPVVTSGSLEASFSPGVSFSGSLKKGSLLPAAFTGEKAPFFDYNAPAKQGDIVGAWSLRDMNGHNYALNIGADGAVSGNWDGCSLRGTIVPRAAGKNVFDAALTYGPAPCRQPNLAVSGVAVSYVLNGGVREFFIAGVDKGRANSLLIFGSRRQ
jgi:hypothetical protein